MKTPELDVKVPEGMNEAEQARFMQALDNTRIAISRSMGEEIEAYVAAMVRSRLIEVFVLGVAGGVALTCCVVVLARLVATS